METLINQQIASLWDRNLKTRAEDLEQGTDLTYTQVIKPWVLSEIRLPTNCAQRVLDIGCGCGYLTNAVYETTGALITGIDISPRSVAYAQKKYPTLFFECRDLYQDAFKARYDTALAVMVLNNIPDLAHFFPIVYNALNSGGRLIAVIPHPVFWTKKHLQDDSFSYMREGCYSIPFSTRGRSDYEAEILYFHRPLSIYLNHIIKTGFHIERVCELCESETSQEPDLLGIVAQKSD